MSDVDEQYVGLIRRCQTQGYRVNPRNGERIRLVCPDKVRFSTTPLVSIRKTSWKSAIREWEWFMSGSNRIEDLHPTVQKWWQPFCQIDKHTLPHNYSKAFRRLYCPGVGKPVDYEPKVMTEDEPVQVAQFPRVECDHSKDIRTANFVGTTGENTQGDTYRVVRYLGGSKYLLQFDSNGYVGEYRPSNFKRGIAKNPYFPEVLGVGCYGVVTDAGYTYRKKAYELWSSMMNRCYNEARPHANRWYKNVYVSGRWKCFENFIFDLSKLDGFEEWLARPGHYQLDKDYKRGNYYGLDTCVFLPRHMNRVVRRYDEPGVEFVRRSITVDQVGALIDGIIRKPHSARLCISTWIPEHVHDGLVNPTNCHGTNIQAYVHDGELSLSMYQRSADLICGVPHNWIQYWAFLLWLCHRTGNRPGTFIWDGGDVHLYSAHLPMADRIVRYRDQVTEGGRELPTPPDLIYTPTGDEFKAEDFALSGPYTPVITDPVEMVV